MPILVIPPLEQEIQHVFGTVAYKAEHEQKQADKELENLKKLVEQSKGIDDKEELFKFVLKESPALAKFIAGQRGATAELTRFNRLLAKKCIASPAFVMEQAEIDTNFATALALVDGITNWIKFHHLSEFWLKELLKVKSNRRSVGRIEKDAHMLARLEWINMHLDKDHKLVYITGDRSLFKAASDYYPENGCDSFAERYLRHPKAYLADRRILIPASSGEPEKIETDFLGLLNTFLNEVGASGEDEIENFDYILELSDTERAEVATQVLEGRPKMLDNFKEKWKEYTSELVLSYGLTRSGEELELGSFKALFKDVHKLLERVKEKLKEQRRKAWNGCYEAAAAAGLGLLIYQHNKTGDFRSRNIPPLMLNSLEKTQDFAHEIIASYKHGKVDSKGYRKAVSQLDKHDESGYSTALIYSLIFAAEGNWYISSLLAAHAMEIASQAKPGNISGREATYLRAFSLRHSARNINDLVAPERLIEKAKECLSKDRQLNKEREKELPERDVRFEAEFLAISLCRHMFRLFKPSQGTNTALPSLEELQSAAEKMLGENTDSLLMGLKNQDNDRWIARNIERVLLSIVFMAAFLRVGKEKANIAPELMSHLFERYDQNINTEEKPSIAVPYQIRAIYLAAGAFLSTDEKKKKQFRKYLEDHLIDSKIDDYSVFPYDVERFKSLRRFVLG